MLAFSENQLQVLNREEAIKGLGSVELFEDMLEEFQDTILLHDLEMLKTALDDFDYLSIKEQTHSLKASSSYIYAERVTRICEQMLNALGNKSSTEVIKYYPVLVEQCIILNDTITQELSKTKGIALYNLIGNTLVKTYNKLDFPISKYFKIIKVADNKYKVISQHEVTCPPIPSLILDVKSSSDDLNGGNEQKKDSFVNLIGARCNEEQKTKPFKVKSKKITAEVVDKCPSTSKSTPNKVIVIDEKLENKICLEAERESNKCSCDCMLF